MSIIDKVMFWKKKDEFDIDEPLGNEGLGPPQGMGTGMEDFDKPLGDLPDQIPTESHIKPVEQPSMQMGPERPASMQPTSLEPKQDFMISKDLEIISTKLDALKASLESINQRLIMLEKMIEQGQSRKAQW